MFFFHGVTASMDQIRVPLIVKLPDRLTAEGLHRTSRMRGATGAPPPIAAQVSTLDIAPTILDFLGPDGLEAQGVSLRGLIERSPGGQFASRVVFSGTETQVSAVDGRRQAMLGRGVPDQRQFPLFHPTAPETESARDYRTPPGRSGDTCGAPCDRAESGEIGLETAAADFSRRGRERMLSSPTAGAGRKDDQLLLARLKALGHVG